MALVVLIGPTRAQVPQNRAAVEQELVHHRIRFLKAWKAKDWAHFRKHIPDNGGSLGKYGAFSREQQREEQQNSAKTCTV